MTKMSLPTYAHISQDQDQDAQQFRQNEYLPAGEQIAPRSTPTTAW